MTLIELSRKVADDLQNNDVYITLLTNLPDECGGGETTFGYCHYNQESDSLISDDGDIYERELEIDSYFYDSLQGILFAYFTSEWFRPGE